MFLFQNPPAEANRSRYNRLANNGIASQSDTHADIADSADSSTTPRIKPVWASATRAASKKAFRYCQHSLCCKATSER